MKHSIMIDKSVLAVDTQMDQLPNLEKGILGVHQECGSDKAISPEIRKYSSGRGVWTIVSHKQLKRVVPSNKKQVSKSECVPRMERILKKLDSIANFSLKILLPKSLTSTPPPDRQIFY